MENKSFEIKKSWMAIIQDIKTLKVLAVGNIDEILLKKMQFENLVFIQDKDFGNLYIPEEYLWNDAKTSVLIKVKVNKESLKYSDYTDFSEEIKDDYAYLKVIEKKIYKSISGEKQKTHVTSVVKKGKSKIAQKFGEEAVELVIEAGKEDDGLFKDEAADVFYYYLIMLQERGFTFSDILKQLKLQKRKV